MPLKRISDKINRIIFNLFNKNKFKKFGVKSSLLSPLRVDGIRNISIGSDVYIAYKTWLAAVPHTNLGKCELVIGDGSRIGNFNHIYATNSIVIGKNVLIADKVYISDNLHSYVDVTILGLG